MPVIAHFDRFERTPSSDPLPGHFVLVVRVTPETTQYVDGTTGILETQSCRDFQQQWTGNVLYVPRESGTPTWLWVLTCVVAGLAVGALVDRWLARRRSRRFPTAPKPGEVPHGDSRTSDP
jgi:hypothetical protein